MSKLNLEGQYYSMNQYTDKLIYWYCEVKFLPTLGCWSVQEYTSIYWDDEYARD